MAQQRSKLAATDVPVQRADAVEVKQKESFYQQTVRATEEARRVAAAHFQKQCDAELDKLVAKIIAAREKGENSVNVQILPDGDMAARLSKVMCCVNSRLALTRMSVCRFETRMNTPKVSRSAGVPRSPSESKS